VGIIAGAVVLTGGLAAPVVVGAAVAGEDALLGYDFSGGDRANYNFKSKCKRVGGPPTHANGAEWWKTRPTEPILYTGLAPESEEDP